MAIERRGPDSIGARTVLAPWWTDHVDDTHRPCTTPNCDGARYAGGLCKRCWHAQIGRNSAADGAGTGLLTPSPAPAPVQTGRNQAADGAGDGDSKADTWTITPSPAPVDQIVYRWAPHWPAAPSLPMDLCSDIPEDDR